MNYNKLNLHQIKALLSGQKPVQQFTDGGQVATGLVPEGLVPYMPTPAEEAASGFPPGPQRALYIAQRKKNSADAANGQNYSDGGEIVPGVGRKKDIEDFQRGGGFKTFPKDNSDTTMTNAEDAADKGQQVTAKEWAKNNPGKQNPHNYSDGGQVSLNDLDPDQLKALLNKNSNSVSDSANTDSLVNAKSQPNDDGFEVLRAKLNSLSDSATGAGQQAATETQGAPLSGSVPSALPNGGLSGDDLASYMKQNPGALATTGTNPGAIQPQEPVRAVASKDEGEDEDNDVPPAKAKSVASSQTAAPSDQSSVSNLLSKLQQPQQAQAGVDPFDPSALKSAQSRDKTVGAIFGTLFGPAARDVIDKHGAVAHLQQQQQVAQAGTEHALKQYALADEKEKNDPNSSVSALARNVLQASAKQAGFNVGDVSKMSASSIEKTAPWVARIIDVKMSSDTRKSVAEQNALMRQQLLQDKQNQKQTSTYNATVQQLEQMRGSPQVAQAEKDLYAASKANTLANLYGDPNKLSMPQVKLLASEIGKIAAGGTSSQHELEGITPNSLAGNLSNVVSRFTNAPSPANAAAFVKQYQDYTKGLTKDAQDVVTNRYGRIINAKGSQFTDDQKQFMNDNYTNRFKNEDAKSGRGPQSQGSSTKMMGPDGKVRLIPNDQVAAATASGGKVVQ